VVVVAALETLALALVAQVVEATETAQAHKAELLILVVVEGLITMVQELLQAVLVLL
jgi:hypothetical protein